LNVLQEPAKPKLPAKKTWTKITKAKQRYSSNNAELKTTEKVVVF